MQVAFNTTSVHKIIEMNKKNIKYTLINIIRRGGDPVEVMGSCPSHFLAVGAPYVSK